MNFPIKTIWVLSANQCPYHRFEQMVFLQLTFPGSGSEQFPDLLLEAGVDIAKPKENHSHDEETDDLHVG